MTFPTFTTDRKLNYSSGSLKRLFCLLYVYESWHWVGTDTHRRVCAGAQACGVHMCTCMWRLEIYLRCLPSNAPLFFDSGFLAEPEALGQASLSHGLSMNLQEAEL